MQNEIVQILFQYGFSVLACFIIYLFGHLLLNILPLNIFGDNRKWFKYYCVIVLGLVALLFIYSVVLTTGKTINILLLPVLLGLFFSKRNTFSKKKAGNFFEDLPVLFLVLGPLFFILLFHLFPESEYKQMDAWYYLQISHSLNIGQENGTGAMTLFGKPYIGTGPYHYLEFWLNAILLKCFGNILPGIQVLRFICYAIISTSGLLGLFALAENSIKANPSVWQKVICILFVFYWPNITNFISFLRPVVIYAVENNILERPNLRILYLFIPGIVIMVGQIKYRWQMLFWLMAAMLTSALCLGVFASSSVLFFLILVLKADVKIKKASIFILGGILFFSALYFLFYQYNQVHLNDPINEVKPTNIVAYFLRYWKIILYSTVTSVGYCLLFPVLILLYLKVTKKNIGLIFYDNKLAIGLSCLVIACSISLARFLNFVENAYQLAFIGYSFGSILIFIMLMSVSKVFKLQSTTYLVICITILLSFLIPRTILHQGSYANIFTQNGNYHYGGKKFTSQYLNHISNAFPASAHVMGAYWADSTFYDSVPYYSNRNPSAYTLPTGYFLAGRLKFNYEVCLSDSLSIMHGIDTLPKSMYDYLRFSVMKSPFYQYQLKIENKNIQRLSFIKSHRLQYLILTKNADTSIINELPISQHFQDDNTGEKFYLIDTSRY